MKRIKLALVLAAFLIGLSISAKATPLTITNITYYLYASASWSWTVSYPDGCAYSEATNSLNPGITNYAYSSCYCSAFWINNTNTCSDLGNDSLLVSPGALIIWSGNSSITVNVGEVWVWWEDGTPHHYYLTASSGDRSDSFQTWAMLSSGMGIGCDTLITNHGQGR